jgi:hypothetical protein
MKVGVLFGKAGMGLCQSLIGSWRDPDDGLFLDQQRKRLPDLVLDVVVTRVVSGEDLRMSVQIVVREHASSYR